MKIIFMGTPAFAVPSLMALCERPGMYNVVLAITQPDRPSGRGRKVVAAPVKLAAQAQGIPTASPTRMKAPETLGLIDSYAPDLLVVAAYGRILPASLLRAGRFGAINVHASLLPRWRGASPIAHAILAGDPTSGISIMQMDEGLDTGPVYCQRAIDIEAADTGGTLTEKLATLGARLLVDTLPNIANTAAMPQPASGITYAPLLKKQDGWLNPYDDADALARRVRAFAPWPGTFVEHRETRLGVLRSHPAATSQPAADPPGTVLEASQNGILVQCSRGTLWLDEVRPAGRNPMSGAAFVVGRGIQAGDVLAGSAEKTHRVAVDV